MYSHGTPLSHTDIVIVGKKNDASFPGVEPLGRATTSSTTTHISAASQPLVTHETLSPLAPCTAKTASVIPDASKDVASKVQHQNLVDSDSGAYVVVDKASQAMIVKVIDRVNEEHKKKMEKKNEKIKRLQQELENVKRAQGKLAGRGNAGAGKKVDEKTGDDSNWSVA